MERMPAGALEKQLSEVLEPTDLEVETMHATLKN